jgi:alpha-L-fucosidase
MPSLLRLPRLLARPALFAAITLLASPPLRADDEALMKKNAAEQAAALNQDPGGSDRKALLDAKMRERIIAGTVGVRTTHSDSQWFGDASLGLFLHWGIASVDGGMDLSWPMVFNMGKGKKIPPVDYWKLADRFKAENYEPKLWLQAAKDAGFDYAVLTAKHHDGYTLWPTDTTDLGVRTHLGGRDLFGEYVAACRAVGLKVGVYYSGPDWWFGHPYMSFNYRSESGGNSSLPSIPDRPDFDINHQPTKVKKMPPEEAARIRQIMRRQLTEILTRYGKIDILWFDGGSGSDITLEEIRVLQPAIVINNRGGLKKTPDGDKFEGDFFTVEHGDQPTRPDGWWEQLRIWNSPTWGYQKANETKYASTASIARSLARTKGWGGVLMANTGPRPDGSMPPPFYQGMTELGGWMKANGVSIRGASAVPPEAAANVPVTVSANTWYLHAVPGFKGTLTLTPGASVTAIRSVKILRTGESVPFAWKDGTVTLAFPEPARDQLHEVLAVELVR